MENDSTPLPGESGASRRDFIRRTAAAGAAVWAAPAILSVSRAAAASPDTPPVGCVSCAASAYIAQVSGTLASLPLPGSPVTVGPSPTNLASVGVPGVLTANVVVATGGLVGDACVATADIDNVSILAGLITTGELSAIASVDCDCTDESLTSSVASLSVFGAPVLSITGAPNQTLATLSTSTNVLGTVTTTSVDIIANRQSCVGGTRSVDALVIQVTIEVDPPLLPPVTVTDLEIILAHAQVNNTCPC